MDLFFHEGFETYVSIQSTKFGKVHCLKVIDEATSYNDDVPIGWPTAYHSRATVTTGVLDTVIFEFSGNSHEPNKSNKTKVHQTVLFGHGTFCKTFVLFIIFGSNNPNSTI